LQTLPVRELSAGLAEVIKYGPIADMAFLDWIETHLDALLARDPAALAWAVQRSCQIKAEVVGQDEREGGLRAILNFGHTFGHAIEAGLGFGEWLHGEAVGCGMVMAAHLSQRLGLVVAELVRANNLAAKPEQIDALLEEITDRFGKLPPQGQTLFDVHRLRVLAKPFGVSKIDAAPNLMVISFRPNPPIDAMKIIELVQKNRHIKLAGNDKLRIERAMPEAKDRAQLIREVLRALGQPKAVEPAASEPAKSAAR
jgi:hypothetical protein